MWPFRFRAIMPSGLIHSLQSRGGRLRIGNVNCSTRHSCVRILHRFRGCHSWCLSIRCLRKRRAISQKSKTQGSDRIFLRDDFYLKTEISDAADDACSVSAPGSHHPTIGNPNPSWSTSSNYENRAFNQMSCS
jgi:hypothetical protein